MQKDFVKALLVWYNAAKRDLPWRRTCDPYRIWVSEIMLQQTRVETVTGYYDRFLLVLPDIASLAACPDEQLLKLWEGLGYYSRVRNMKKTAQIVCAEYGGQIPGDRKALLALPGIGSYTAGAILSIAYGLPEPAVDGNVLRVYARLTGLTDNILLPAVRKKAEEEIRDVMLAAVSGEGARAGDVTQALIELGAMICVPGPEPKCGLCPIRSACRACAEGTTGTIPVRIKNNSRRIEELTVLLVRDGENVAIRRRKDSGLLAGLYEFPNLPGRKNADEVLAYMDALGYTSLRIRELPPASHRFSHVEWRMTGYEIRISQREETADEWIFAECGEIEKERAIPSAFAAYAAYLMIRQGQHEGKDKT